jgi:hypothetical protein
VTAWSARSEPVAGGERIRVDWKGKPLSVAHWLGGLASDPEAAARYTGILAAAPWPAFFWEHPPLTAARLDEPLECVLLDAPQLAGLRGDPSAFAGPFAAAGAGPIARFPNLGGDAELVAPRPDGTERPYPHLAALVRHAPPEVVRAFWRSVALAIRSRLGSRPLWVSTSGLGVPWLHVRLDSSPKYYQHRPYRQMADPRQA